MSTKILSTTVQYAGLLSSVLLLSACAIPRFDNAQYVPPLSGASVVANTTGYTEALDCLGLQIKRTNAKPVRIAVGRVEDFSGKQDLVNGKRITQGTALMVLSAVARTRLPIVERLDTSLAEMEFKYTDNKLIGTGIAENPVRVTIAGSVVGSDYHIVGGVTEVNYNIRSGSLDGTVKNVGASTRYAVLDVAIDLRLVNTKTLQIENVVSFQKQIIGTEIRAGLFRFLSDNVIDVNAGEKAQEPIQKAIRMVAERSVFQLIADLYKLPAGTCEVDSLQRASAPNPAVLGRTSISTSGTTNNVQSRNGWFGATAEKNDTQTAGSDNSSVAAQQRSGLSIPSAPSSLILTPPKPVFAQRQVQQPTQNNAPSSNTGARPTPEAAATTPVSPPSAPTPMKMSMRINGGSNAEETFKTAGF